MVSLSSVRNFHNSKFFFSKIELSKILSCYSLGVARGNWKDYAITFTKNEAIFYMFKSSLTYPDCILTKINKSNKNVLFKLEDKNKKNNKFNEIDDLLALLKRSQFKII